MTTRERIAKGIADHDRAIDEARQDALTQVREPFADSGDAYESAKGLAKFAGVIFSRLAQRREAVRNIGLLDYEQAKLSSVKIESVTNGKQQARLHATGCETPASGQWRHLEQ